ncbi:MAG: hypothetical protein GY852_03700 [bacterium]|nr:hypothetical protein [bacterium]
MKAGDSTREKAKMLSRLLDFTQTDPRALLITEIGAFLDEWMELTGAGRPIVRMDGIENNEMFRDFLADVRIVQDNFLKYLKDEAIPGLRAGKGFQFSMYNLEGMSFVDQEGIVQLTPTSKEPLDGMIHTFFMNLKGLPLSALRICEAPVPRQPGKTCGRLFVHVSEKEKTHCSNLCASRAYQVQKKLAEKKPRNPSARKKSTPAMQARKKTGKK